jgi:hypothetical protein
VPVGIFPKLPEERSSLLFRAKGWGEGAHSPWTAWERGRRGWGLGEKRVSRLNAWGIIGHPCCPGRSCPKAVLEHWKQEVTSTLGLWKQWRKHKRSDCLFAADIAGGVWDLATFGPSGQVKKFHLQPLGDMGECPSQNTFCGLKTNFHFHQLFSDLLLSGSDLERESYHLRRGKKKKSLGVLKLGSTYVALAVQNNPSSGVQVSSDCLPYSCSGLRAFPQFPKG